MGLFDDLRAADAILGRVVVDGLAAAHTMPDTLGQLARGQHNTYTDSSGTWHEYVGVSSPLGGGEASDNVTVEGRVLEGDALVAALASGELDHPEPIPSEWSDMGICDGCGAEGLRGKYHTTDLAGNPFLSYCGQYR